MAIDTRLSANAAVLLAQVVACVDPGCVTYRSYRYPSEPPLLPGENSIVVYIAGPRPNAQLTGSRGKYVTYEVEYRFVMSRSFVGMLTPALQDGEVQWAAPAVRDRIAGSWINDMAALFNCLAGISGSVLGTCGPPHILDATETFPDGEGFRTVMSVTARYGPSAGCTGPGC